MNDVLAELLDLLQAGVGANITSYYQGEVLLVPQSYLPALMIWGKSTEVIAKSTACDQSKYTIGIRVVVDLKKYVDVAGVTEIIKAQEALINIMEERTDGVPDADTVLGVLRDVDNIRGIDYLFNNEITINYSTVQRGEFFYAQAEMELNATTDLRPRPV